MPYVLIVLAVIATAALGSAFTTESLSTWYLTLNLPSWTPPGSVIGAVWTILYTLLAIAGVLAWKHLEPQARKTFFWLYGANLVLNALWSYLFFSAHRIGVALAEMLLLEASLIAMIALLWNKQSTAAYLLLPYAAWVAFATYLTFTILRLN